MAPIQPKPLHGIGVMVRKRITGVVTSRKHLYDVRHNMHVPKVNEASVLDNRSEKKHVYMYTNTIDARRQWLQRHEPSRHDA